MASDSHDFTMSEQVEILCALDAAITDNAELIGKLRAAGLHELVKPREQALARQQRIRTIITECLTLTATKPFATSDEANEVWGNDRERIDYGPGEEQPPF